jgi:hypothetical protein
VPHRRRDKLVGRAGLEPATNGLKEAEPDEPARPDTSESER